MSRGRKAENVGAYYEEETRPSPTSLMVSFRPVYPYIDVSRCECGVRRRRWRPLRGRDLFVGGSVGVELGGHRHK